jgi:shikimate kinase
MWTLFFWMEKGNGEGRQRLQAPTQPSPTKGGGLNIEDGRMASKENVTLVGMPGSGKTTIGQHLAWHWGWTFFDIDHFIERSEGKRLEEIIDVVGFDEFLQIEARYVQKVSGTRQVISTGGSVVYVDAAMQYLRCISTVVYLDVPVAELEQRAGDLKARGVVIAPGKTMTDLWRERHPLYLKYAHLSVVCQGDEPGRSGEAVVRAVAGSWK